MKTIFPKRIEEKISTGSYKLEEVGEKQLVLEKIFENIQKLKKSKPKIVLPESLEERILKAGEIVLANGIARIVFVGNRNEILKKAESFGIDVSNAEFISIEEKEKEFAELLFELRKEKGISLEKAKKLVKDPVYFGVLLVKSNLADGMVAGAINDTAKIVKAALQVIGVRKETKTVSGAFIMVVPHKKYGEKFSKRGVFLFADCAVTINPTAEQLADISLSSASTLNSLFGLKPKIALLSYSTDNVEENKNMFSRSKIRNAIKLLKKRNPELVIEGEIQLDAAIIPDIAVIKNPASQLKGEANILIFPNLECGNIGYKLVERLAEAEAIGPLLQGLKKPVNDLSRGCSVEDIVNLITITAYQSLEGK